MQTVLHVIGVFVLIVAGSIALTALGRYLNLPDWVATMACVIFGFLMGPYLFPR